MIAATVYGFAIVRLLTPFRKWDRMGQSLAELTTEHRMPGYDSESKASPPSRERNDSTAATAGFHDKMVTLSIKKPNGTDREL